MEVMHGDVFRQLPNTRVIRVYSTGVQPICMPPSPCSSPSSGSSPWQRWAHDGDGDAHVIMSFINGRRRLLVPDEDSVEDECVEGVVDVSGVNCEGTVLNILVWGQKRAAFRSHVLCIMFLVGISVPLTFVGSYLGFKRVWRPVRTNKIPANSPQPWYMHDVFFVLVGGILPFGAVFIEPSSSSRAYGFNNSITFSASSLSPSSSSSGRRDHCLLCYFQLCTEDYRWWWRSFLTSGAAAFYMFAYGIVYYKTKLVVTHKITTLIYFGYMTVLSLGFFILTGTVGFLACLAFVRAIYGSVKIDYVQRAMMNYQYHYFYCYRSAITCSLQSA